MIWPRVRKKCNEKSPKNVTKKAPFSEKRKLDPFEAFVNSLIIKLSVVLKDGV